MILGNIKSKLETFAVLASVFVILWSARLAFIHFISDHWFGTLGLTSLILGSITYLSWKDKLGRYGQIYKKALNHKIAKKFTKIRIISGIFLTFWLASFSAGMHWSDSQYHAQTQTMIEKVTEAKGEEYLTPEGIQKDAETQYHSDPAGMILKMLLGLLLLPLIVFLDFPLWSVTTGLMNHAFGGQFIHVIDILLVEELEVFGLMLFIRHIQKKQVVTE